MTNCLASKIGTGLLLDAQIPPEAGAYILGMYALVIGGGFGLILLGLFLLTIYIPLLISQMDLLKLVDKKCQTVEFELSWMQLVPVLNFFMAYIVAYHLKITLEAINHENETNLSLKANKIGQWYCHSGMLLLASIPAAVFVSVYFLFGSGALLFIWIFLARKYLVSLDDIYTQMNGPELPTVQADLL
jgi:hypothetical protein